MASRTLQVQIVGDSRSLEHAFKRSSSSAKRFDHDIATAGRGALTAAVSFRGMGRALSLGSAQFLGGAGIAFAIKSIVTEASRVQEEVEKTGVVFGRNAHQVQAWSKTLAQSFGVGEGAALEAAGTFGNMLRPLQFGQKDAAGMSERLVELAADMASFNNTKPEVVLQALSSGLAGQVRPLRQYGVFLSEARISQEAMALGISKTGKNLTQHQKTLASYNIILKDTKNAQGDVARNTGSLSVAMSKLRAGVEDLEAGMGQALLPSITEYVNLAAAWLNKTENQQRVQRDFKEALALTKSVIDGLVGVVKEVDKVTGSFKHTMELLLALKVASTMGKWAKAIGGIELAMGAGGAAGAAGKATTLGKALKGLTELSVIRLALKFPALEGVSNRVLLLLGNLTKLRLLGPIGIVITIGIIGDKISDWLGEDNKSLDPRTWFKSLKDPLHSKGPGLNFILGHGWKDDSQRAAEAYAKQFHKDMQKAVLSGKAFTASPAGPQGPAVPVKVAAPVGPAGFQRAQPRFSAQSNRFFDSALTRSLDRVQDLQLPAQIAKLKEISALIVKRIAATKDITRKLSLEDQLVDVKRLIKGDIEQIAADAKQAAEDAKAKAEEIKQKMQDAAQAILDALQFNVTKAQLTATLSDDLAALEAVGAGLQSQIASTTDVARLLDLRNQEVENALAIKQLHQQQGQALLDALSFGLTKAQATASFEDDLIALKALQDGIKKQIAAQGRTLELQQQLFDVGQQIIDARKQQKQARLDRLTSKQFRQIGLTGEGDEVTPSKQNLQKRLKQLTGNITGTTLDTPKLRAQLAKFRRVLAEGLVPKGVRAKIREMMDDIANELKDGGNRNRTKFKQVNSLSMLGGLNLTPEQKRVLSGRLSTVGAGGTVPGVRSAAFSGAGAGKQPIVVNSYIDGRLVATNTTTHQTRAGKRRPDARRGTYAGRN